MRRFSLALALSTLSLVSICSAQLPPVHGHGTTGMIPVWQGTEINQNIGDSPLGITMNPMAVQSTAPLNLNDSGLCYQIAGDCVLRTGNTGDEDLFIGVGAGASYTPGNGTDNTFAGQRAGNSNTTGNSNTFYGHHAGAQNTTGSYNVFVGTGAGEPNVGGNDNTFAGYQTGYSSSTGTDNTFYGYHAGLNNTTGSFNTYVGDQAGVNNVGSSNTYLGYLAGQHQTTESNTMRLGADGQTSFTFIAGVANTNLSGATQVYITSEGQLGVQSSSLRFKEQVRDMGDSTDGLMKLRPVTFFYKPEYENGQHTLQYGLVAEEVAKVYPELVAYDKDGKPYSVRYQYITTMLLNEVQRQYHRAEAQAELIKAQQQEIDGLKKQLQVQNTTIQERLSRLETLVRVETAAAQ